MTKKIATSALRWHCFLFLIRAFKPLQSLGFRSTKKKSLFWLRPHSEKELDKRWSVSQVCNYSLLFEADMCFLHSLSITFYNVLQYFLAWRSAWGWNFKPLGCPALTAMPCFPFPCSTMRALYSTHVYLPCWASSVVKKCHFQNHILTVKLLWWREELAPL